MKTINYCPCCGSTEIKRRKTYTFTKPRLDIERNYQKLVDDIVLERLYILFDAIIPGHTDISVDMAECSRCRFFFLNPRVTQEDLKIKYDRIASLSSTKSRYRKYPARHLDTRARRIHDLLLSTGVATLREQTSILDVGGAWGYNLMPFVGSARLYVVDFEQWRMAPEISWLAREVKDIPERMRFDCIMCLHTLEHVADPYAAVELLASHLTDGGLLYVEVPLGVFREIGHVREPITHINFFCEKSVHGLFTRAGLEVVHLSTKYQWVTTGRQWCVNIVGMNNKGSGTRGKRPKSAFMQRMNPLYYVAAGFNRLVKRASALLNIATHVGNEQT